MFTLRIKDSIKMNCCAICGRKDDFAGVQIMPIITHKKGSFKMCPNCTALYTQIKSYGFLDYLEETTELKDDIHNTKGAIRYQSDEEDYSLKKNTFIRLIMHNLTKPQWRKLQAKRKGQFSYMLHDDFYDEEGEAIQPMGKN